MPNSVPLSVTAPVPPFATGSVPVTPVVKGRPVAFVSTAADGVPKAGVTSVGEVARTGAPDPVAVVHTGKADAPPPTRISVVAPAASVWCAPVAVVPAAISPYAVVDVARPVPPCATVTAALSVNTVDEAFGNVNVLADVAGPDTVKNAFAVPPFAVGRMPVTPVVSGKPVALVKTAADGVPRAGVTSVGEVANTNAPVPVSSVTAAIAFALEGVARNVATPVPSPLTPVEIGSPVALVSVPLVGVPKIGVTKVGDVFRTTVLPVPVVVAELIAVPLPARAGALTVVDSVMFGVEVELATDPASPLALVTVTLETVPPPEK